MKPRWCAPVVVDLALLLEVDTKRVEGFQNLGWKCLISNLSEVFAVVTSTAIASTFLNFLVTRSRGFNICLNDPRPEIDDGRRLAGNRRLLVYSSRVPGGTQRTWQCQRVSLRIVANQSVPPGGLSDGRGNTGPSLPREIKMSVQSTGQFKEIRLSLREGRNEVLRFIPKGLHGVDCLFSLAS